MGEQARSFSVPSNTDDGHYAPLPKQASFTSSPHFLAFFFTHKTYGTKFNSFFSRLGGAVELAGLLFGVQNESAIAFQ